MTRSEAEDKFRELAEANEVLRNSDLRKKHDEGEDVSAAAQQGSKYSYDKRSVNPDGTVKGWMEADGEKVMMHFTIGADGHLRFGVKDNTTYSGCELEHLCLAWSGEDEEHRRPRRMESSVYKTSSPLNNASAIQIVNMFDLVTVHLHFNIVGVSQPTSGSKSAVNCNGSCNCNVGWSTGFHSIRWEGIQFPPHVIAVGDALVYELLWDPSSVNKRRGIALDLVNNADETLSDTESRDQHGLCANAYEDLSSLNVTDKWAVRVVKLPNDWAGNNLANVLFACEYEAGQTLEEVRGSIRNIKIVDGKRNLKIRILADRKPFGI